MKKYILSLNAEQEIKNLCPIFSKVEEGYLSPHDTLIVNNDNGLVIYEFGVHYETIEGDAVICSKITEDEFNKLSLCVKGHILAKMRYVLQTQEDSWFIDCLKNEQEDAYFIIAEQYEPQEAPEIPEVIRKYFLKAIEYDAPDFSNRRLANEVYATKKLSVILKKNTPVVKKTRLRKTIE